MKHRLWELGKDLVIVLLVCSLLLLAVTAVPAETIRDNPTLSRLLQPLAPLLGLPQAELAYVETALPVLDAARPLTISINNSAGRYTAQWDFDALDAAFETFGGALGQALDTAEALDATSQVRVQRALSGSSVYLEYGCSLPATVLASWLDAALEAEDAPAAWGYVLALENGTVNLYLVGERCYAAKTQVQPELLEQLLENHRPDGSHFAFETGSELDPLTLLPGSSPAVFGARVSSPGDTRYIEELAAGLGFNPYSDTRYTDADSVTYFTENNCALEIGADGAILLVSTAPERFQASGSGQEALVEEARRLVELAAGDRLGDARIYLAGLTQENGETVCTFDYLLSGIPVAFSSGSAATVTFSGRSLTRMEIRAAAFTLSGEILYPLPMAQAAAVLPAGSRLTLQYHSDGEGILTAGWKQ